MKRKSTKFLALLLAAVLTVSPTTGVSAQEAVPVQTETAQTEVQSEETEAPSEEASTGEVQTEEISSEEPGSTEVPDNGGTEAPDNGETEAPDNGETEAPDNDGTEAPDQDGSVSGNKPDNGTVSDNTVSDNTVSSNTVSANDVKADSIFPGMPDGYALSADQLDSKAKLASYMSEFSKLGDGTDYVSGEVMKTVDSREEAEMIAAAYGGTLSSYGLGVAVIKLAEGISVAQALEAAVNQRVVLPIVWPDYYQKKMSIGEAEPVSIPEGEEQKAASYSDPFVSPYLVGYQWQHNAVGSIYAWNGGYTGKGVKVAVLDTGGSSGADLSFAGTYNAIDSTDNAADGDGHGTHVAGIIGAIKGNHEGGAGIAPDVSLYAVKVLGDDGSGSSSDIIRGINYAAGLKGNSAWKADIINMSLGGPGYSGDYEKAVTAAAAAGVAIIAAAGNDSSYTKSYPAAYEDVICVAATNQSSARASFSNYGPWVDLSGPGVDILSTMPSGYGIMSGTSQAAPVIAGTAAVILSAGLKAIPEARNLDRVKALKKFMMANTTKGSGSGIGSGIVNLPKALKVSTVLTAPNKPVFDKAAGAYTESIEVTVKAEEGMAIYYSTDGKTPSFKNGLVTNGILYVGPVKLGDAAKTTLKAIAVNEWGKASAASSVVYSFKPLVSNITITGPTKLVRNKTISLTANIFPSNAGNKKLAWTVSPEGKGVTVANGKVKASKDAAAGDYIVTAASTDTAKITGSYTVTVAEAALVKKISLVNKEDGKKLSTLKLNRGNTDTAEEMNKYLDIDLVSGEKGKPSDVTWNSSNPGVAYISEAGMLMAKGGGKAVVTASAADGSGVSAKLTVQVTQYISNIEIIGNNVIGAGASAQMKVSLQPATVSNKAVVWGLAEAVNGVSVTAGGKVSVKAGTPEGTVTVTAKAKDAGEVMGSKVIAIKGNAISKLTLQQDGKAVKAVTLFRESAFNSPEDQARDTEAKLQVAAEGGTGADLNAYTVTSSNPGIAAVSQSGSIVTVKATGKAVGTANITVQTTDGSNKKAVCKVTVNNPVTRILISPEAGRTSTLGKGKSLKLTATLETAFGTVSNKKVIWKSSNEDLATVSNGKVTAKNSDKLDYVTITATAADGSGVYEEYEILVLNPIKSIKVNALDYDPKVYAGVKFNLTDGGTYGYYMFSAGDAKDTPYFLNSQGTGFINRQSDYEVNVEVSNPDVLGVSNGEIIKLTDNSGNVYYAWGAAFIFKEKGMTKVTLKAMDGSGAKTVYNVWIE